MPDFFKQFAGRLLLAVCVLISPTAAGCQWWVGRPPSERLPGQPAADIKPAESKPAESKPEPAETVSADDKAVLATDDPRFLDAVLDALRSPAAEVRLEAVEAWSAGRKGTLPIELVDLRTDSDPRVRGAVLKALARQQHPKAQQYITAALRDLDFQVRIAAIGALGQLGGAEARANLEKMLKDRGELIRGAAVSALDAAGARRPVSDAAADKSWRVRLVVAETLRGHTDRAATDLARRLLDDPSPAVQQRVLAAIANWPLDPAGPILLGAMEMSTYSTRKTAARQLAARWPPAAEFPVEGPNERRGEVLESLRNRFRQQFGFVDRAALPRGGNMPAHRWIRPITAERIEQVEKLVRQAAGPGLSKDARRQTVEALERFGPDLIEALEQIVLVRMQVLPEIIYREVLPCHGPDFRALDRLNAEDVLARRRAAGELVTLTADRPLRRLAVERLACLMVRETDQLVWQSVLTAVAADPSDPAIRLAYAAIGHPSPEVRRRACEHLAAHADPRHAAVLLPALDDTSNPVVEAAVRALGATGRLDDTRPLERLLGSTNQSLRVEAAVALVRLGNRSGIAALERLAYSNDPKVRCRVAQSMGELADPVFVPTLIRFLDDRDAVRRAGLESLPKMVNVAGEDAVDATGRPPASTTDRVAFWKSWFERQRRTASKPH